MTANSLAEIEAEIVAKKEEIKQVHGTESEVYARIVGYYRPVRNWNKGKAEEYTQRELYELKEPTKQQEATLFDTVSVTENMISVTEENIQNSKNSTALRYEFFSRKTCPNCPPVRNYLKNVTGDIVHVDVDSDEGLARASELGVFAAPTVILFDGTKEIGRAHSTTELENLVKKTA